MSSREHSVLYGAAREGGKYDISDIRQECS